MSQTTSATTGWRYGLERVCRLWEQSRSAFYARRDRLQRSASADSPCRRGPTPALSDAQLLAAIRNDLARSPFQGEGHRKVHARLRILGEASRRCGRSRSVAGPSPRVRGSRARIAGVHRRARSIPACAGKPRRSATGPTA